MPARHTDSDARQTAVTITLLIITVVMSCLNCASHCRAADFERDVAPVLIRRCLECHSASKRSGGLLLTTRDGLRTGGDSGAVVVAGDPAASLLLDRIRAGEMPPPIQGRPQTLPADELELLTSWIRDGAAWPDGRELDLYEATSDVRAGRDWWSLQPVTRPPVPDVDPRQFPQWQNGTPLTDIDRFVLARLADSGMQPAPLTDRRELIRRAYDALIGLPPTTGQIEAFVDDESADAWPKLVDELLASPHYGERQARHWLDVVRYADTSGYERDQPKPFAWKYRDWVVSAFNSNMPYDRFIVLQLAGDEIADRDEASVIATGLLRLGTWNDEPNDPEDYAYDRLEDLVHTTSSAFLGMTVKCARCHDHKFDPVPQTDYYRMAAAFWPGPLQARDRALLGGPSADELGLKEVLGWTDLSAAPAPLHVLKNGNRQQPQQEIAAASLSFIPDLYRPFDAPPPDSRTTHRRLQLAEWIADPRNPLTPRVMVNRIWQNLFGQGLVRSPNVFGFVGDPPTHPELLDWLAAEFLDSGMDIKALHRRLLLSHVWQQSSSHPRHTEYSDRDFLNRLLWRAERRRRDAESLRDALLSASGEIDLRIGGPGFTPDVGPAALEGLSRKAAAWTASAPDEQRRRSLYMETRRSLLPPMLTTFNFADTTLPCGQRDVTTVAPQALELLNSEFAHGRSATLARRIADSIPDDAGQQIHAAWKLVLGREPHEEEVRLAHGHLQRQIANFSAVPDSNASAAIRRGNAAAQLDSAVVIPNQGLVLHLRADRGITADASGRVTRWTDQSGKGHDAHQAETSAQPARGQTAEHSIPVVEFDGNRRFLNVTGSLLADGVCTIFAVVSDAGRPGHREIISNWNGGAGNAGTSVFLGLTAERTIRFTDAFSAAGEVTDRDRLFLLTALNASDGVTVYQSRQPLAKRGTGIGSRRIDTAWVIGQQGNIQGEYWHGAMAEVLVYDRALTDLERDTVWQSLMHRYRLNDIAAPSSSSVGETAASPEHLALASLCHVLLNSNEFLYID